MNDNMNQGQALSLNEIHKIQIDALIKLVQIIESVDAKYSLFYGSLIGAVRHKGFIPWDDDVDIVMPRNDYERLIEYCYKHKSDIKPYEMISYKTNKGYIYPIARFSDKRYKLIVDKTKDYCLGVFVDIYPMDGCGDTIEKSKKKIDSLQFGKNVISIIGQDKFERKSKTAFRKMIWMGIYYIGNSIGIDKIIKRHDLHSRMIKYDSSKYVANLTWMTYHYKEIMKREWIDNTIDGEFEGNSFKIPKNYDIILKQLYGDYMQLPPEDKRVPEHYYNAYKWIE